MILCLGTLRLGALLFGRRGVVLLLGGGLGGLNLRAALRLGLLDHLLPVGRDGDERAARAVTRVVGRVGCGAGTVSPGKSAPKAPNKTLTVDDDAEAVTRHALNVDAVKRRDDVVRAVRIDLLDRVGRADGDRPRAGSNTGADTRGRVLEDDALLDGNAELLGGEDEGGGVGLAGGQAGVVGGDSDLGALNSGASEGTVAV